MKSILRVIVPLLLVNATVVMARETAQTSFDTVAKECAATENTVCNIIVNDPTGDSNSLVAIEKEYTCSTKGCSESPYLTLVTRPEKLIPGSPLLFWYKIQGRVREGTPLLRLLYAGMPEIIISAPKGFEGAKTYVRPQRFGNVNLADEFYSAERALPLFVVDRTK